MSTLNRHAQDLSKVFRCLVKDVEMQFPALSQSLSQDLARVEAAVFNRGNHVFLVDMPQLGKHLDRSLASGHYNRSGIALSKRASKRVETPKFLQGIHLMVFDSHGCLRKDACPNAVAAYRQLLLFAKKYYVQPSEEMVSTAVEAFILADMERPKPSRFWQMESEVIHGEFVDYTESLGDSSLLSILATVARMISSTLGHYCPQKWRFKHGPGASADRTGKFDKYDWSNWSDRLESVFPFADYGFHSYSSWASFVDTNGVCGDILPSKLSAVPKTATAPRLIAAEPVANMWCQQNLHHYFASRFSRSWIGDFISLHNQGQNRALALRASVSGNLATVDLSAASDSITCYVVELLFKSNMGLLRALRATRTPCVSQSATNRVADTHTLNMYSTMGNATTFPVESLVFLAIAITAVLHARGQKPNLENIKALHGEVSVYGDDIIVPVESRDSLLRLFHLFGMDCNHQKTFFEGNFRESCGCDAFRGHDVTPFYWRRPYGRTSESLSAVVDFRNEAYSRYMLNCSTYAESTLPRGIPEVAYGLGAFGFSTRLVPETPKDVRWNTHLQRYEARVLTLTGRNESTRTDGHSALLQYFTEAPSQLDNWEAGYVHASKLKTAWRYTSLDSLGCSVPTL